MNRLTLILLFCILSAPLLAVEEEKSAHLPNNSGFLNQDILFESFLADPRQCNYSNGMRFGDNAYDRYMHASDGSRTGAVGVNRIFWVFSVGDRLGLYLWKNVLGGRLKVSLEGGIWSVFALRFIRSSDEYFTSMINADFRIGVPVTWARENWAVKVSIYHESTHLGDEMMKETYDNDDQMIERVNPSVEILDVAVSWKPLEVLRVYLLLGVHLTSDETYEVKPFFMEYGVEYRPFRVMKTGKIITWSPYLALHIRNWQDHNFFFDITARPGVEFGRVDKERYKMRFYGEYHFGHSLEGQFTKNWTDYFGFAFTFGF